MPPAIEDVGLGRRPATAGDDVVRSGSGQGLEHHLGHEMADLHARGHRRRKAAVDNAALRGGHSHRPDGALVDGHVRVEGALHGHEHVGVGEVVDHVPTPVHLGRGATEIHMQIAALDGYGQPDGHVPAFAGPFDRPIVRIDPVGDPRDRRAHAALGAGDDLVGQVVERVKPFIPHHLDDFLGADMVGRDLRADVAGHLLGGAHVPADHAQDVLVELAGLIKPGERDEDPFLVNLAVVRGHASADVRMVEDAGGEGHQSVFEKDGAQYADIVQMPGQQPGVVHDKDVPGPVAADRHGADDFLHAQSHGAGLARRAEGPLHEFLAAAVGEHASVVVGVAQQAGEGGPRDRCISLVHDGHQPPPQDLQRDGIEAIPR